MAREVERSPLRKADRQHPRRDHMPAGELLAASIAGASAFTGSCPLKQLHSIAVNRNSGEAK